MLAYIINRSKEGVSSGIPGQEAVSDRPDAGDHDIAAEVPIGDLAPELGRLETLRLDDDPTPQVLLKSKGGSESGGVETQTLPELVQAAVPAFTSKPEGDETRVTEVSRRRVHLVRGEELQPENWIARLSDRDQGPEAGVRKDQVTKRIFHPEVEILGNEAK